MSDFKNQCVLITGGTSGMGLVTAELFLKEGARVFISGRNKEQGSKAVQEIGGLSGACEYIQCDVTNSQEVQKMMDHILTTAGGLDIAINNAGITSKSHLPLADFDEEDWKNIINVNLNGLFYCMKYEIGAMLKRGKGVIVNNSSVAGLVSLPMQAAYSASKAGVIALTESAAIDYAQKNIRINAIAPGPILGGMNNLERLNANPERTAKKLNLTAMHRFGDPLEVANSIVWLCSPKASFITGATIAVDGGFTAGKW